MPVGVPIASVAFGGCQAQVMNEHDHGPMLNAELPKRLIELIVDGDL